MKDDEQKRIFSRNLKRCMSIVDKPQSEVAKAIGVSPQTFNTWFNGIALPRMGKVQALADYFHCYKSDLIEDKPAAVPSSDCRAESKGISKGLSDDNSLHLSKNNGFSNDKPLHQDESNGFYDTDRLLAKVRKYGADTPEQRAALSAALDDLPIPDDKRELMKGVLELDPDQAAAFLAFAKTVVKRP